MFTHKGTKIEVISTGQFRAEIQDVELIAPSLKEIQDKIDREVIAAVKSKPLKLNVLVIASGGRGQEKPRILEALLTGINRTTSLWALEGLPQDITPDSFGSGSTCVCPNTQPNRAILERFLRAYGEYHAALALLDKVTLDRAGYGRIGTEQYPGRIRDLERDYRAKSGKEAASGS